MQVHRIELNFDPLIVFSIDSRFHPFSLRNNNNNKKKEYVNRCRINKSSLNINEKKKKAIYVFASNSSGLFWAAVFPDRDFSMKYSMCPIQLQIIPQLIPIRPETIPFTFFVSVFFLFCFLNLIFFYEGKRLPINY